MKKVWIWAAIGAALLAAILLALFFLSPKVTDSGDSDSRYPYTYTERKDGLDITITGAVPEGYQWVPSLEVSSAVKAEVSSVKKDRTVVSVQGTKRGTAELKLVLQTRNGSFADCQYELDIKLMVEDSGAVRVIGNTHQELVGIVTGTIADGVYTVAPMEDGRIAAELPGNGWEVRSESDNTGIYQSGTLYYIEGYGTGEDRVIFCRSDLEEAVAVAIHTEHGTAELVSVDLVPASEQNQTYSNPAMFRTIFGEPVLPENAALVDMDVQVWEGYSDSRAEYAVGIVTFRHEERTCQLLCVKFASEDNLVREMGEGTEPAVTSTAQGTEISAYEKDGTAMAVCTLDSGIVMAVRSEELSGRQASALLASIVE